MKKLFAVLGSIGGVVVMLIAMVFGKVLGRAAVEGVTDRRGDVESALRTAVAQMQPQLPMQLDADTRLVAVRAVGTEIQYQHVLSNADVRNVTHEQLVAFGEQLRTRVCNELKTGPLLKAGGTMAYLYRDGQGQDIGTIRVRSANCAAGGAPAEVVDGQWVGFRPVAAQPAAPPAAQPAELPDPMPATDVVASTVDPESRAIYSPRGIDPAKEQRCVDQRNRAIAAVPEDAPLGDCVAKQAKIDQTYRRCLG